MRKNILQKKEVETSLSLYPNNLLKRDLERYARIARTYLQAGAELRLRGNNFVFTLPTGEATFFFDPWKTAGSGNCIYTHSEFDSKTGERLFIPQLIPATPQLGRPFEGVCAWQRLENRQLFNSLLDLLTPYIK